MTSTAGGASTTGAILIKLNEAFLGDSGLGPLPPAHQNLVLASIYEELELRVGLRLASRMSSAKLDEFEALIDATDEAAALAWLEENFPDYRTSVQEEFDRLCLELRSEVIEISAAAAIYPQAEE